MIPSKTRSLRKYEAEAQPCTTAEGEPLLELFSPFGPMIAKTTLPAPLIDQLNQYADGVIGARQGLEFIVPQELAFGGGADSLAAQAAQGIRRYLASL